MRIMDLINDAEVAMRVYSHRFGQGLSNSLFDAAPETYNALMADERYLTIDPFHNDDNVTRFIGWLIEQGWEY